MLYSVLFIHLMLANPRKSPRDISDIMSGNPEELQTMAYNYLDYIGKRLPLEYEMKMIESLARPVEQ